MKKSLINIFLFIFISTTSNAKEVFCEIYLKNIIWISGDLEMSLSIPHRNFVFNIFYENKESNQWFIKNVEFTDQLKNKIREQQEKEIIGINKLLKTQKKIKLRDLEEISNIKINSMKMMGKNYMSEMNRMLNNFSKKEREDFLKDSKDNSEYLNSILDFEKELIEMKKGADYLVFFDDYKRSGNSVILTTVTDSGILVESSFKNSLKNNKINVTFTNASSLKLEGSCSNQIAIKNNNNNNNTKNDDSIESKLKKLKSLFEQQLITQEEYDAKRKEILDAM